MSDAPSDSPRGDADPLHPALHTRVCELLDVRYPIVQTGMGWVSGARLTAATSAAGGFGILAAVTMTMDQMRDAIRSVKEHTPNPFGVNFRPDQPDLDERLAFVTKEGVKLVSFAGAPTKDTIAKLHDAGILAMPTVGARRHAEKMLGFGVDLVIAQGGEGGGHTGTVPTSLLLPQVVDAFPGPVVGAGGFHDGRGLVAALAYGCAGIAMGTRFLLTQDSRVPDEIKAIYLKTPVTGTVVSTHIDGHPQRVIRTEFVEHLEGTGRLMALPRAAKNALEFRKLTGTSMLALVQEGLAMRKQQGLPWSQVALAANAPMLTKASMVDGHAEAGILPTGQVVGLVEELPTVHDLIQRIMDEAEQTLKRLGA